MSHFVRRTAATFPAATLAVAMLVVLGTAPASANGGGGGGGGTTTRTVINVPAMPIDNLCNLDMVVVHGDMTITVTVTQLRHGGKSVRSTAAAWHLNGNRVFPDPPIGYHAADVEHSNTYTAPAGGGSYTDVHWTKLVPEGPAPTMYLVVVFRQTILANNTAVTTLDRAYLVCTEPCRRSGS